MKLILASQSPYRKLQLEALGISFSAEKPQVNEDELKTRGPKDPKALCEFLARAKGTSLKLRHPTAWILGCDQLVELDGKRLDKPGSRDKAILQLGRLQGRSHRLITSIFLIGPQTEHHHTNVTEIHMRSLQKADIEAYVDQDQAYDCAGSYKIEKAGASLITSIRTDDPSSVQGIPLMGLTQMLLQNGFSLRDFWQKN